jgi:hypothetical protein
VVRLMSFFPEQSNNEPVDPEADEEKPNETPPEDYPEVCRRSCMTA